jgi:hypothetical protein
MKTVAVVAKYIFDLIKNCGSYIHMRRTVASASVVTPWQYIVFVKPIIIGLGVEPFRKL